MNKKSMVIGIVAIILLTTAAGFWIMGNEVKKQEGIQGEEEKSEELGKRDADEVDTSAWKTYINEEYGFKVKYPKDWVVRSYGDKGYGFKDNGVDISWQGNRITLFPTGKSGSSCYLKGFSGDFERLNIDKYAEEFFIKAPISGRSYGCSADIDNYPKSWNEKVFIEMEYDTNVSNTVKNILQNISFLENTIDQTSLRLYGSRAGVQGNGSVVNTSDWLTEKNDTGNFSFRRPQNAKLIDEKNCYRVEYGLGFVIFFLPVEGDMRCGARTGVGVMPDNVEVVDYLTIGGEKYEAPGFNAVIDTKGEESFKPETRYFYDFNHMLDLNKEEDCGNAGGCERVEYGIYKEVRTPLDKESIDDTMNTLRAIVASVNVNML